MGEYLSKQEYGALDSIPVTELGLNWCSFSSEEEVKQFLTVEG